MNLAYKIKEIANKGVSLGNEACKKNNILESKHEELNEVLQNLQMHTLSFFEKVAFKVVSEEQLPVQINKENLNKFIGNSYRTEKELVFYNKCQ